CVDMNDRQLRFIVDGLNGRTNGVPREDGFDITVACEIMAVLCLASSLKDLKERLAKIVVAFDRDGKPVTAKDLKAHGAMAALLKDAIRPNLVQTLEKTPAIIHGGPFANIAHGCNSVIATYLAMGLSDYTITEAGFGADLGAEKFFDIKCRSAGLKPSAVVVVATIRALKMHGGLDKSALGKEDLSALKKGLPNLLRHVDNIVSVYKLPAVVAVNKFPTDTEKEVKTLIDACAAAGVKAVLADGWAKGGAGMTELAENVVELCKKDNDFSFSYPLNASIEEKIETVVKRVYRGKGINVLPAAKKQIEELTALGFGGLPVCIAKTQYSFSDDPKLLGAPEDFTVTVRSVRVSAGAGFIVVLTGDILTMPGLPKKPAAENIDVSDDGVITGLF
ncbi:MAG: formate--tetrahydrofolate ligase, partial [Clostridia bacterium]|nr:formate--tetrahydrofolate ligase [Clostridia bacterium]